MSRGISRADANKAIRQEALREQLANKGLLQKVIEDAEKIANLDEELDHLEVTRLKAAADLRLKVINKYLPDLKSAELEVKGAIEHNHTKQITQADLAALRDLRKARQEQPPIEHAANG